MKSDQFNRLLRYRKAAFHTQDCKFGTNLPFWGELPYVSDMLQEFLECESSYFLRHLVLMEEPSPLWTLSGDFWLFESNNPAHGIYTNLLDPLLETVDSCGNSNNDGSSESASDKGSDSTPPSIDEVYDICLQHDKKHEENTTSEKKDEEIKDLSIFLTLPQIEELALERIVEETDPDLKEFLETIKYKSNVCKEQIATLGKIDSTEGSGGDKHLRQLTIQQNVGELNKQLDALTNLYKRLRGEKFPPKETHEKFSAVKELLSSFECKPSSSYLAMDNLQHQTNFHLRTRFLRELRIEDNDNGATLPPPTFSSLGGLSGLTAVASLSSVLPHIKRCSEEVAALFLPPTFQKQEKCIVTHKSTLGSYVTCLLDLYHGGEDVVYNTCSTVKTKFFSIYKMTDIAFDQPARKLFDEFSARASQPLASSSSVTYDSIALFELLRALWFVFTLSCPEIKVQRLDSLIDEVEKLMLAPPDQALNYKEQTVYVYIANKRIYLTFLVGNIPHYFTNQQLHALLKLCIKHK